MSLFVSLVTSGAACGGGGGVSIQDLPDEVESAFCDYFVECGRFPDKATCEASAFVGGNDLLTLQAGVAAGTIHYDEGKAGDCLDALRDAGCTFSGQDETANDVCDEVFTGTVADAGACAINEECVSLNCVQTDPSCNDDVTCCAGTCGAAEPAPTEVAVGGDCYVENTECVSGAYCQYNDAGTAATCVDQAGANAACTDFDGCEQGLYCDYDFQTNMGTCKSPPQQGDPCEADSFGACDRMDNYCDPTTMVCTAKVAVGGACTSGVRCVDYAYCDGATMLCVASPAVGETCDVDGPRNCLGDLECTAGTCAAPPAGMSCI